MTQTFPDGVGFSRPVGLALVRGQQRINGGYTHLGPIIIIIFYVHFSNVMRSAHRTCVRSFDFQL